MDAITITRSKILIVEGNDPYRFFIKLLLHLQIDGVQVIDFGGNDELRKKLIALPNIPGFNSVNKLAIIRDAEESNPKNILSSISDALRKNNILCPEILNVFQENNGIHIGIFLLPDNIKEGMLEDLCIMSIEDSPEMVCINEFLNCAKLEHNKISKSKMLCYFALKDPKANSIAIAVQKTIFDFDKACFENLKSFLLQFN